MINEGDIVKRGCTVIVAIDCLSRLFITPHLSQDKFFLSFNNVYVKKKSIL